MTVRRFIAPTSRDCLRKVKEELGADSIVVSNKPVHGGVEIAAMTAQDFEALSRQTTSSHVESNVVSVPPSPRLNPVAQKAASLTNMRATLNVLTKPEAASENDYTVSLSRQVQKQLITQAFQHHKPEAHAPSMKAEADRPKVRPLPKSDADVLSGEQVQATLRSVLLEEPVETEDAPKRANVRLDAAVKAPAEAQMLQLMTEMQSIKALLERQLAGFAWGDMSRDAPSRALMLVEMLDAGFSSLLAHKICMEMPAELSLEDSRKWIRGSINRRLRTLGSDNDIIERGGVYALVGPTGVGKTTTTAKLAARCVVKYGADKIALLTTDGYRIGAHEQLRIYGRILGVPVHVVRDGDDLRHTLADLRDKHMVLIDTVGMSQRDRMVAEQAAMLMRAGEVNRLLLLNATTRGDTLDDVVRAYAGEDLAGIVLSKVDEAASLAPALDVAIRHGLLLCYVANGQRVPEDLHLPNRNYLMHRAFKQQSEASPHRLHGEEAGMIFSPSGAAATMGKLRSAGG